MELFKALTIITLGFSLGCATLNRASKADELASQSRYPEAIELYREHMRVRLADNHRPDWENPHFYQLSIADLELRNLRPEDAIKACDEALASGVDQRLVSDRYRAIARWYQERGEFQKAFDLLSAHRGLDPLIFDAMLDRIGREM